MPIRFTRMGVGRKRKKLYAEIGILAVIIIVAISFIILTQQQTTQEATGCAAASIVIDDVVYTGNDATVTVKNTGLMDLNITSARLWNDKGNSFEIMWQPMPFYKGESKPLLFPSSPITCDMFSKVVIKTNCPDVSDTYIGAPKGC